MKLSANTIKRICSLHNKKFRNNLALFIAEGEKLVEEAERSAFTIVEKYRISDIGEEQMKKISALTTPSPTLAVIKQQNYSALELLRSIADITKGHHIYLALDGVKDPGNLGTIIRLADWFGVEGLFLSEDCVELYNPKTVQATMGAIFRVKVSYTELTSVMAEFRSHSLPVVGTLLGGNSFSKATALKERLKSSPACLIVLGSESFGISPAVEALIEPSERIVLPAYNPNGVERDATEMGQTSESLNVATAAAIILSQIRIL